MALSNHAKVGVFTLICLVALSVLIVWKSEILMIKEGYKLIGSFNNIEGLTIGSEVRYRGLRVGKVMDLDAGPEEIRLSAVINSKIKFPSDSVLRVSYDGIVGLKYLEIVPGKSTSLYQRNDILYGVKTAGIVDFVDIGAQNLVETKKILESIRSIVENPKLQAAIINTVYIAEKLAGDLEQLTNELRQTNQGIRNIVADSKFQESVKNTMSETSKTLTSANKFFDATSKLNLRAAAGVDVGSQSNAIRADVDIMQNENNYFRLGVGEGPSRTPGLLDVLFNSMANDQLGYRLGVINNQIGGGLAYFPNEKAMLRGDIYDINNPRPSWPKVRVGYEYEIVNYMNMTIKGDDLLNSGQRNLTVGIKVKAPSDKIY